MLYLVATPIGNLEDITLRAARILSEVDFICCEDTRVSIKLLNHLGIKKQLVSYFAHNMTQKGEQIIQRLKNGETAALISDAGMPAISDPGEELVKQCIENSVKVTVIPGASACISAISICGLDTGRFTFEGFVSVNKKSRIEHLQSLKNERRTMVFYEAPHKLQKTLNDFLIYFGNRKITICRELTKLYEEIIPTTITEAIEIYNEKAPKGEFVLVLEGKEELPEEKISEDCLKEAFKNLLEQGITKADAVKELSKEYNIRKNEIYNLLIK